MDQAGRRTVVIVGSPDEAHSALRMMVQKLLVTFRATWSVFLII